MPPDTEIEENIDKILKAKLSSEEYEKVKRYIKDFLEERYNAWEEAMGEDL